MSYVRLSWRPREARQHLVVTRLAWWPQPVNERFVYARKESGGRSVLDAIDHAGYR
jgi:hypothetical protein